MGRFDDRATAQRGPWDLFKWKLWHPVSGQREKRDAQFRELDAVRPGLRDDGAQRLAGAERAACWIGHASWVLRLGGLTIVTDPIWSPSISGVARRLVAPGVALSDLPPVDVVTISHDHRDHMDMPTLERIGPDPLYVVPVGNGPRIARLGFPRVVELDWWESHTVADVEITLVPSRHWSMRTPLSRNATLWGGFVYRSHDGVAYHAGDTAAGDHFAAIGERVGPIDWAMLPIGGYAPRWFMQAQHMGPREAGEAIAALRAEHLLAMHWGTFRLTDEAIGEPPAHLRQWWRDHGGSDDRLWILDAGEVRCLDRGTLVGDRCLDVLDEAGRTA